MRKRKPSSPPADTKHPRQRRRGETPSPLDFTALQTLVFEGGSVKLIAAVGALEALNQHYRRQHPDASGDVLTGITRVAGTSAGAILSLLIALGLPLSAVRTLMEGTSFGSIADAGRLTQAIHAVGRRLGIGQVAQGSTALYSVGRHGYVCNGDEFYRMVSEWLAEYAGQADITFRDLAQKPGTKSLHVYAVRMNDGKVREFSAQKTPHVEVRLAVRMSMSIPIFFKPVRVTEREEQGQLLVRLDETHGTTYYIDGGVRVNYPYAILQQTYRLRDETMLGFKVDSAVERLSAALASSPQDVGLRQRYEAAIALRTTGASLIPPMITALMSPQEDAHRAPQAAGERQRTIYCADCDISTFQFNLSEPDKARLLTAGQTAVTAFLQARSIRAAIPAVRPLADSPPADEKAQDFIARHQQAEAARLKRLAHETTVAQAALPAEAKGSADAIIEQLRADVNRLKAEAQQLARPRTVLVARGAQVGKGFRGTINRETSGTHVTAPENLSAGDKAFLADLVAGDRVQEDKARAGYGEAIGAEAGAVLPENATIAIREGRQGATITLVQRTAETIDTAEQVLNTLPPSRGGGTQPGTFFAPRRPRSGEEHKASSVDETSSSTQRSTP